MIRSNSFAQGCNTREEIQSMLIGSLDRYEKEIKRIVIWAKDPKGGYLKNVYTKRKDPIKFLANLELDPHFTGGKIDFLVTAEFK